MIRRLRPPVEERICFLHIPKCGGTSLHGAFAEHYTRLIPGGRPLVFRLNGEAATRAAMGLHGMERAEDVSFEVHRQTRQVLVAYALQTPGIRYVSGHFHFSGEMFRSADFKWVTVLRDPVERFVSSYFYNRYKTHSSHRKIERDLDEHIAWAEERGMGGTYVRFLGGVAQGDEDPTSNVAVGRAKVHLERFHAVGLLEDLPAFAARVEGVIGRPLRIDLRRPGPVAPGSRHLSRRQIGAIRTMCRPDLDVYEHARSLCGHG